MPGIVGTSGGLHLQNWWVACQSPIVNNECSFMRELNPTKRLYQFGNGIIFVTHFSIKELFTIEINARRCNIMVLVPFSPRTHLLKSQVSSGILTDEEIAIFGSISSMDFGQSKALCIVFARKLGTLQVFHLLVPPPNPKPPTLQGQGRTPACLSRTLLSPNNTTLVFPSPLKNLVKFSPKKFGQSPHPPGAMSLAPLATGFPPPHRSSLEQNQPSSKSHQFFQPAATDKQCMQPTVPAYNYIFSGLFNQIKTFDYLICKFFSHYVHLLWEILYMDRICSREKSTLACISAKAWDTIKIMTFYKSYIFTLLLTEFFPMMNDCFGRYSIMVESVAGKIYIWLYLFQNTLKNQTGHIFCSYIFQVMTEKPMIKKMTTIERKEISQRDFVELTVCLLTDEIEGAVHSDVAELIEVESGVDSSSCKNTHGAHLIGKIHFLGRKLTREEFTFACISAKTHLIIKMIKFSKSYVGEECVAGHNPVLAVPQPSDVAQSN
ncbi:hypothetical protein VP01_310g3 [Puccinia sorghi]|uniref:Uncharacterized protein n=1 Tax=Puccinia sorghi TaxID=27349 RepID=A0A0L6V177_9BASI|nr:hypothetical protein VP01_310g3 [Puccinia sorghi]